MNSTTSLRVKRWLGSALSVISLGCINPACDQRFDFDTQPGGAGAGGFPVPSAGAAVGGAIEIGGGVSVGGAVGGSTSCGAVSECLADTHCVAGECVQCAADADCAAYGLPRCEPTRHRCVACVATTDCRAGFACDSLANRCLQTCTDDNRCPASAHGCDERRQVCYQCDEDRECATSAIGPLCASDGSGCVQCRKEADCPNQHCDQLSGRCVECRDGHDCASQICSPTAFNCLSN